MATEAIPTVPKGLETRNIMSQSFSMARQSSPCRMWAKASSTTAAAGRPEAVPTPQVPSSAVTLTPNPGQRRAAYSCLRFLKRGNLDMGLATSISVGQALR